MSEEPVNTSASAAPLALNSENAALLQQIQSLRTALAEGATPMDILDTVIHLQSTIGSLNGDGSPEENAFLEKQLRSLEQGMVTSPGVVTEVPYFGGELPDTNAIIAQSRDPEGRPLLVVNQERLPNGDLTGIVPPSPEFIHYAAGTLTQIVQALRGELTLENGMNAAHALAEKLRVMVAPYINGLHVDLGDREGEIRTAELLVGALQEKTIDALPEHPFEQRVKELERSLRYAEEEKRKAVRRAGEEIIEVQRELKTTKREYELLKAQIDAANNDFSQLVTAGILPNIKEIIGERHALEQQIKAWTPEGDLFGNDARLQQARAEFQNKLQRYISITGAFPQTEDVCEYRKSIERNAVLDDNSWLALTNEWVYRAFGIKEWKSQPRALIPRLIANWCQTTQRLFHYPDAYLAGTKHDVEQAIIATQHSARALIMHGHVIGWYAWSAGTPRYITVQGKEVTQSSGSADLLLFGVHAKVADGRIAEVLKRAADEILRENKGRIHRVYARVMVKSLDDETADERATRMIFEAAEFKQAYVFPTVHDCEERKHGYLYNIKFRYGEVVDGHPARKK